MMRKVNSGSLTEPDSFQLIFQISCQGVSVAAGDGLKVKIKQVLLKKNPKSLDTPYAQGLQQWPHWSHTI